MNAATGTNPNTSDSNQASDVDSLTSGMNKIKISFVTTAQKQAREQEKLEAKTEQSQVDGTTSTPTSDDKAFTGAESDNMNDQSENSLPMKSISPTPSTPESSLPPHIPPHIQETERVLLPATSPIGPSMEQNDFGNSSANSSEYNAYKSTAFQPQGSAPSTMAQQEPPRWLPPNTSTPAVVKKHNLPVFTSTSAIPFAPSPNAVEHQNEPSSSLVKQDSHTFESTQLAPSIWDIPATPRNQ